MIVIDYNEQKLLAIEEKDLGTWNYSPPPAASTIRYSDVAAALAPMSTDREVITGVETGDVQYNAAAARHKEITTADTVSPIQRRHRRW
jgi:hypothetical protein